MSKECGCKDGHWECKPALEPTNALAIKLMYESNVDTNVFNNADKLKLDSCNCTGGGGGTGTVKICSSWY